MERLRSHQLFFTWFISFIQTVHWNTKNRKTEVIPIVFTNNGGAKLPCIYSKVRNKSEKSFRKETAPFLSILTLAVTDNQLENCVRHQPERTSLPPPKEIRNRFFTSVDLVDNTEVHGTLRWNTEVFHCMKFRWAAVFHCIKTPRCTKTQRCIGAWSSLSKKCGRSTSIISRKVDSISLDS